MTAFLARRGFLASGLAAAGIFASARRPILAQAPAALQLLQLQLQQQFQQQFQQLQ